MAKLRGTFFSGVFFMPSNSKTWWKSKTIWVNGLSAGIAVLTALQGQAIVQDYPRASAAVVAGLSVLNVGLRLITYLPLEG